MWCGRGVVGCWRGCAVGLVRRGGGSEGSPVFFSGSNKRNVVGRWLRGAKTGEVARAGGASAAAAGRSVSGAPWAEVGGRGAHLLISRCQTVIAIFRDEANGEANGGEQSAARSVVLAANSVQILQKCNLTQTQQTSPHAHHLVSPHPCNARQTRRRIDIVQSRRADPFPHAHRAPPALP